MPFIQLINTDELEVYDGGNKRCRLNGAAVTFDFDNGTLVINKTTNSDGVIDSLPTSVSVAYTTVKITITKAGYFTVKTAGKVTWSQDQASGTISIKRLHVHKR